MSRCFSKSEKNYVNLILFNAITDAKVQFKELSPTNHNTNSFVHSCTNHRVNFKYQTMQLLHLNKEYIYKLFHNNQSSYSREILSISIVNMRGYRGKYAHPTSIKHFNFLNNLPRSQKN